MKLLISQNGVKRRHSYFRTHLANRCAKYIEATHRCSQTEFRAWRRCRDAECGSQGRGLVGPLSRLRVHAASGTAAAKHTLDTNFAFHFYLKSENPLPISFG